MLRYPYKYGDGMKIRTDDPIVKLAVKAIQQELTILGENPGPIDGLFGFKTAVAVKNFQTKKGLVPDGHCTFKTNAAIFLPRIYRIEQALGIPAHYLKGMVRWESAYDPGATGPNEIDSGLVQINLEVYTDITREQAFDPAFALNYGANRLKEAYESFKSKPEIAWQCAVAQHNSPRRAREWFKTGTPPDEKIAGYVNRIMSTV